MVEGFPDLVGPGVGIFPGVGGRVVSSGGGIVRGVVGGKILMFVFMGFHGVCNCILEVDLFLCVYQMPSILCCFGLRVFGPFWLVC